jgi:hypothetical protein
MHDASVFQISDLFQNPQRYFEDNAGYIVGDSAYGLSNYLIRSFSKVSVDKSDDGSEKYFNALLSSGRVNVEHAFGIMKSRFCVLKQMAFVVGTQADHARVLNRLRAMCCLHNFLLDRNDIWELTDNEWEILEQEMNVAYEDLVGSSWYQFIQPPGRASTLNSHRIKQAGKHKRESLKDEPLNWGGRPTRKPG